MPSSSSRFTLLQARIGAFLQVPAIQRGIIGLIAINAVMLGFLANPPADPVPLWRTWLVRADLLCLILFSVEILLRLSSEGRRFWTSGWNIFDAAVVSVAWFPEAGPWAVLRALRVLRILRLLTSVPSLRKVVAAFLHAIPGLSGVGAVMIIFLYTAGVLATGLFGPTYPQWFGSVGASLFTLFQIMTLESWSMGIVRPVMETHPVAWLFFVPFIIVATFTILNLFIGIIVSTMQELSLTPDLAADHAEVEHTLGRIEADLRSLRRALETGRPGEAPETDQRDGP